MRLCHLAFVHPRYVSAVWSHLIPRLEYHSGLPQGSTGGTPAPGVSHTQDMCIISWQVLVTNSVQPHTEQVASEHPQLAADLW